MTHENELETYKLSNRVRLYRKDEFKEPVGIDNVIGSGGFAEGRKYYHKDLSTVAIKQFTLSGDPQTINKRRQMVQREVNILCRFHHKNIVKIFGITEESNTFGIVMEYVDGGNLEKLLWEEKKDLSWRDRLQIAHGTISALSYIHNYKSKKMFCHGDLKPQNILLTNELQVKLADFGSASLLCATGASATTLDITPSTQQTLIYVAPEYLENLSQVRVPAMDIYSFGSVMYELISRRSPFSDCSLPAALPELIRAKTKPNMQLIDKAECELKSGDDRSVFNLLKGLMERCWKNDPKLRPSSKTVEMELSNYSEKPKSPFLNRRKMHLIPSAQKFKQTKVAANEKWDQAQVNSLRGNQGFVRGSMAMSSTTGFGRYHQHQRPIVQRSTSSLATELALKHQQFLDNFEAPAPTSSYHSQQFYFGERQPSTSSVRSHESNQSFQRGAGTALFPSVGRVYPQTLGQRRPSELSVRSHESNQSLQRGAGTAFSPLVGEYYLQQRRPSEYSDHSLRSNPGFVRGSMAMSSTPGFGHYHQHQRPIVQRSTSSFADNTGTPYHSDASSLGEHSHASSSGVWDRQQSFSRGRQWSASSVRSPGRHPILIQSHSAASSPPELRHRLSVFGQHRSFESYGEKENRLTLPTCHGDPATTHWSQTDDSKSNHICIDDDAIQPIRQRIENLKRRDVQAQKTAGPSTMPRERLPALQRKLSLNEIFNQSGASSTSAFSRLRLFLGRRRPSTSSGTISLPDNIREAPKLLKNYKRSLNEKKFEEASAFTAKLSSIIVNHVDVTAEDVRSFGIKLRKQKRHLEAIAMFDAAAAASGKMKNPEADLKAIATCVGEMNEANIDMVRGDSSMKVVVKNHVLLLMHKWLHQLENTLLVPSRWRCLQVCTVLSYIERSEHLVNQWEKRERTLRAAIRGMRDAFGYDVNTQHGQLLGILLSDLGDVCQRSLRFEEASFLYKQSIDAFQAANDYRGNEEKRKEDIAKSKKHLKITQIKLAVL